MNSIQRHNPPLILVADDAVPTTIMLERVFEYEGYQVKSVYDGISALDSARVDVPDLILLDVNMPGMNGFDVLTKLREDKQTASIPTILITAMGEISDVVQGLNLGADDYLRKPFHPQEVLARAQTKMRAKKLEESLQHRTQELEALLRVSEELSQHLEMSELMDFIIFLVSDLLHTKAAAIYLANEPHNYRVEAHGIQLRQDQHRKIIHQMNNIDDHFIWSDKPGLLPEFPHGIGITLQYGGIVCGFLIVGDDHPYDTNHIRLLKGVGRSAILAVKNAELYIVQAQYAQHLEDMVSERTAELKSAQHMLVQSEKLASVGRLSASVAHEIKNPLFPIRINLENMLEDLNADQLINPQDITRTLESVDRIQFIVDRLLGFTGNWQLNQTELEEVDLNNIVENIVILNNKYFNQENVAICQDLSDIPSIRGHRFQLEQVFMNLALNAKDAMEHGGTITFHSYQQGDEVVIEVIDSGHGIPLEMQANIFEPFVSTKEDGNGLGLFISHNIIQEHQGTIDLKSEEGQGTQFTLRFPAIK